MITLNLTVLQALIIRDCVEALLSELDHDDASTAWVMLARLDAAVEAESRGKDTLPVS